MKRRTFLIGTGSAALGGSALLGSGAFSKVESQRSVTIQVAEDPNAYLGMDKCSLDGSETPNSSYAHLDGNGHLELLMNPDNPTIGNSPLGEGINSDSFTYFDGMFELCNQGKADATVSYELPDPPDDRNIGDDWTAPDPDYDDQVVGFYYIADEDDDDPAGTRVFVEEGQEVPLALGDCVEMGVRTVTKGVDATIDAPLIDGEAVVTADAPGAGEPTNGGS